MSRLPIVAAAVFFLLATHPVRSADPEWRRLLVGMREGHAMAFDEAHGVTVLFGGTQLDSLHPRDVLGDTWTWDGERWNQHVVAGPRARTGHGMVYDSARGVTVLFGGHGVSIADRYTDTWEWDGAQWTARKVYGPPAFGQFDMVFDRHRGVTVLVGGEQTWEWNGLAWILKSRSTPTSIRPIKMAYDAARNRTLMIRRTLPQTELWEWDGATWTFNSALDLFFNDSASFDLTYDRVRNRLILVGTAISINYRGTWEWDGRTWTEASLGGPDPTPPAVVAFDSWRNVTVCYSTHTAEWDGDVWTPKEPGPLKNHAMAFDAAHDEMIVFGGYRNFPSTDSTQQYQNGTWAFKDNDWQLRSTSGPALRSRHAMVYDESRAEILMFGGFTNQGARHDTWTWNGSHWTRLPVVGPTVEGDHWSMAYDPHRAVTLLVVSNLPVFDDLNETWEWNGKEWTFLDRWPTEEFIAGKLAYDGNRQAVVGLEYARGRLWQWNGLKWIPISTDAPRMVAPAGFAFDPNRMLILFYGRSITDSERTWEWDGVDWTRRPFVEPAERHRAAMAYHGGVKAMMLLGGDFSASLDSASIWVYGDFAADFDVDGDVDLGDFAVFSNCYSGEGAPPPADCPTGVKADFDGDGDVDLGDFAEFANHYTGAH